MDPTLRCYSSRLRRSVQPSSENDNGGGSRAGKHPTALRGCGRRLRHGAGVSCCRADAGGGLRRLPVNQWRNTTMNANEPSTLEVAGCKSVRKSCSMPPHAEGRVRGAFLRLECYQFPCAGTATETSVNRTLAIRRRQVEAYPT